MIENRSKFTPLRCAQVIWQVLEEIRLFFEQRLGPDYFVNGGTHRFPMVDMEGLIDDVCCNNPLNLVTLLGRWHFKHDGKFGYNNQGVTNTWQRKQYHRSKIPTNTGQFEGGCRGVSTTSSGPDLYITTFGVIQQLHKSGGIQRKGSGWQQLTPDPRHPNFSHFIKCFLQRFGVL